MNHSARSPALRALNVSPYALRWFCCASSIGTSRCWALATDAAGVSAAATNRTLTTRLVRWAGARRRDGEAEFEYVVMSRVRSDERGRARVVPGEPGHSAGT